MVALLLFEKEPILLSGLAFKPKQDVCLTGSTGDVLNY